MADELLAAAMRDAADGATDLIMNDAYPLPTLLIAQILGIPGEDFGRFRGWVGDIGAAIDFPMEGLSEFPPRVDQTTKELCEYLRWVFALRKSDPQDDLISRLAHVDTADPQLDEDEVMGTCILLLVAGHETTVNLIGNGTLALLRHQDQWQRPEADPGLARNAPEELLRFDSPVQLTTRVSFEPIELADGFVISPAAEVFYVLGSANRDAAAFSEPDRLDISRKVDRMVSFGLGIHFCLGLLLARLEGETAFGTLSRRAPHLALATDSPVWRPGAVLHGLRDLPVMLD